MVDCETDEWDGRLWERFSFQSFLSTISQITISSSYHHSPSHLKIIIEEVDQVLKSGKNVGEVFKVWDHKMVDKRW